jgi:hypothetical protein
MTSKERHEARYLRRKAKRDYKKSQRLKYINSYDEVFSFDNLYNAYKHCRKGVAWKSSIQKYIVQAPINLAKTHEKLMNGTYRSSGFYEFNLFERGKKRHIRSVTVDERIVQNCLCDNCLVPALSRTFIYDNGAAIKNKGYSFAVKRLNVHLQKYYRKFGNSGYILVFDFSKFFDNISHELVKKIIRKEIANEKIIKLAEHFIDAFGAKGLGLGSQISQILSLSSANQLDHFIKEKLSIKYYGRYMDDGYLIHQSKEYLQKCLSSIKALCSELGIVLNEKKTQIVKLSHGFTWLKMRIFLTDSGKIVKKMYKRSITNMRQKLKKLYKKYKNNGLTLADAQATWQSWSAYSKHFRSYHTRMNMKKLYLNLFYGGKIYEIYRSYVS